MDLLMVIIGVTAIVTFVFSLFYRPHPPIYQLVIAPEPPTNGAWVRVMAWVIAIAMIAWLATYV